MNDAGTTSTMDRQDAINADGAKCDQIAKAITAETDWLEDFRKNLSPHDASGLAFYRAQKAIEAVQSGAFRNKAYLAAQAIAQASGTLLLVVDGREPTMALGDLARARTKLHEGLDDIERAIHIVTEAGQ